MEGKPKSRHWKRSILHKDPPISSFLRSSSPISLESNIADVFIKAFRLRGDTAGLNSAVLSRFTVDSILASYKLPVLITCVCVAWPSVHEGALKSKVLVNWCLLFALKN